MLSKDEIGDNFSAVEYQLCDMHYSSLYDAVSITFLFRHCYRALCMLS